MDYTITYGGMKSIKYRFHEPEVMERLRHEARKHAQKVLPINAEMDWDGEWWDDEENGLIIEFTCEFKSVDIGKTEIGKV